MNEPLHCFLYPLLSRSIYIEGMIVLLQKWHINLEALMVNRFVGNNIVQNLMVNLIFLPHNLKSFDSISNWVNQRLKHFQYIFLPV